MNPEAYKNTEQDSLLLGDMTQQRMRACYCAQCFCLLPTTMNVNFQKYFNLITNLRRRGQSIYSGSK